MKIYKVTNKVNGMCYIGQTKHSLEHRWKRHIYCAKANKPWMYGKLQKAIREFGESSFVVEQIDVAANKNEANEKEVFWIQFYDSIEHGYNTSRGGKDGGKRIKVKCVETGIVYESIIEACAAIGVAHSAIYPVVNKPHLKCGGYHWISV